MGDTFTTETNAEIIAPRCDTQRRDFLQKASRTGLALAGASLTGASLLNPTIAGAAVDPPLQFGKIKTLNLLNLPGLKLGNDVRVLNYALTLEDLESDLYVQAIQRLTTGGANALGKTIPGLGVGESEPDVAYLLKFAEVEAEHRDFLRGSLNSLVGGLAVAPYKYDFGIESKTREQVVDLVLNVEALGVQAYLGAIPYLKTKTFVAAAAAIQGTEARHTAVLTIIQKKLFGGTAKSVAPRANQNNGIDTPLEPNAVLAQASQYIVKA